MHISRLPEALAMARVTSPGSQRSDAGRDDSPPPEDTSTTTDDAGDTPTS